MPAAESLPELSAQSLLQAITSGALITDASGRIVYANPAFLVMAGNLLDVPVGGKLADWLQLPPKTDCALCLGGDGDDTVQWASFHGAALQSAPGGESQPEALRVKVKHSALPDGRVLCLMDPFSEDTTLTQAHNDFVSTVSHEFRTPLTSIKGFADTLLAYGAQLPEEEKRRFINIIKDQADRLIRLVENLLTVSKLGAGRQDLSYRPVPLARLIDRVIQSVQAKVQAKQPQVVRQFDVLIRPEALEAWADPDRLEQVLMNLVDNAVKYSPANATVRIRAEFQPEDDSLLRIQVRDEGPGIPKEILPRLFTKFYRVESPLKQEVEGTGLGLYITQSLTNSMGGRIEVDSEPGKGSVFTVMLPAATPERQAAHRRRLLAEREA